MIVETLLMEAVKDGHLSVLAVLLGALLYQMRQHTKSVDGVAEMVKKIDVGCRKALDDNISQQTTINDIEGDIKEIKEGVVWSDTFKTYVKANDKRISLIEKKTG